MSQLGMGAMLHILGGGSPERSDKYAGRVIKSAKFDEDFVDIEFEDGVTIRIFDGGQSCCEHRYLTLDDNIEDLVGQTLVHIMEKGYKDESDEEGWVEHETCFLEIQGNKSSITFAAHNEHNGYYGGFGMSIKEI